MSDRVEFEIVGVKFGFLKGRFRVYGKEVMCAIHWDGTNFDEALEKAAIMAVSFLRRPPPPTLEMMQAHVGKSGSLDVEVPTDAIGR